MTTRKKQHSHMKSVNLQIWVWRILNQSKLKADKPHIHSDTSWYNTKWGAREQPPKHKKGAPVETSEPSKWGAHRNQLEPNFKKRRSSWSQSFNKSWKDFSFLEIKRFEVNYVTFDNIKCTTSHNNIIWVMYYRIFNGNINNVLYSHKP
jgi:hypothetical protein